MALVQSMANLFNPSLEGMQAARDEAITENLTGKSWPPPLESTRIEGYHKNAQIVDGDHQRAFARWIDSTRWPNYIPYNVAELITLVATDLLMGEPPALQFDTQHFVETMENGRPVKELAKEAKALQDRWRSMHTTWYEWTADVAALGDGIGHMVQRDENSEARFEPLPVVCWYPERHPDNQRGVLTHRVAWVQKLRTDSGQEVEYVKVVEYPPNGTVVYRLFLLKDDKLKVEYTEESSEWALLWGEGHPASKESKITDRSLLLHLPNWRYSREYFGRSESNTLDEIYAAINNRGTQTNSILQNHSDPKMTGPPGLQDQDTGEVDVEELGYVVRESVDQPELKYVDYPVKVEENVEFMDKLIEFVLMKSETAKVLITGLSGGGSPSGRSLKFQILRSLAKANRKRRYHDFLIPEVLWMAQVMEGTAPEAAIRPTLKWSDGLPQDVLEMVEELEARERMGIGNRLRAVKRLDKLDDKGAQAYLDEVDADNTSQTVDVMRQVMREGAPVRDEDGEDT